ncbi:MAG: c-type cytochrome [Planctomycetales bacterium]
MPATETVWRNLKRMHVIFAVSSAALLVTIVWMMAADHADQWRDFQRTSEDIVAAKLRVEVSQYQSDPELQGRMEAVRAQLLAAESELADREAEIAELRKEADAQAFVVDKADRELRGRKAFLDKAKADHGLAVRDQRPQAKLAELLDKVAEEQQAVDRLTIEQQEAAADLTKRRDRLAELTKSRDEAQAELRRLRTDIDLKHAALVQLAPETWFSAAKRKIMEWPIIDGFNSHLEVKHDWMPSLRVKLGMSSAARFDNCRTCHLLIDRVQAGNLPEFPHGHPQSSDPDGWVVENKFPHPYATHHRPELYVTAASPHPAPAGGGPGTFGCTVCHEGQGSATSFDHAEHTADNPHEAQVWDKKYGHHPNHHWEYPMFSGRLLEATCLKCHHQVEELGVNPTYGASAPQVVKGYHLIREYGCFGCHEIQGFDGPRSIGPDIRLEPNYTAAAEQVLRDPLLQKFPADVGGGTVEIDAREAALAQQRKAVEDVVKRIAELSKERRTQEVEEALRAARRTLVEERMKLIAAIRQAAPAVQAGVAESARPLVDQPHQDDPRHRLQQLLSRERSLAQQDDAERGLLRGNIAELVAMLPENDRNNPPADIRQLQDQVESLGASPRLSQQTYNLLDEFKDFDHPGAMRKVGPALRHIASKTTPEWIEYWTEEPQRFRPDTRMPQFFNLSNQHDPHAQELMPVELAGIAQYLMDKSQPLDLMQPPEGYVANAERGARLFSQRGCLACHSHEKFPGTEADFGPDLTKVHEKVKPGEEGRRWLYTWVRDPQRYHPRSKMPNLYLEPEGEGDSLIDPAADIAAFLLQGGPKEFPAIDVKEESLDDLVRLFLSKNLTAAKVEQTLKERRYPEPVEQIKGDEIELARAADAPAIDDEAWREIKLNYVGRKTISRYGCYGCHDVPGFENARPIGTTLQDWGRKDVTRLAPEHIHEYLHHHGEPDGGSTHERIVGALQRARSNAFDSEEQRDREMSAAYFYDNLLHHGRDGFLWQKLRDPRSYDYEKTETRGYEERLRMPKFPFDEEQIEAIATFVLGLVAEPPASQYVYQPTGPAADRIAGEKLLRQYNCTGCHMVELPLVKYGVDPATLPAGELSAADHPHGLDLLLQLKPPREARTGETSASGEPVIGFHGLQVSSPDPEEDEEFQEYGFDLWETLQVGERRVLPGSRMLVNKAKLESIEPARGGDFALWLVERLKQTNTGGNTSLAWQMAPPPLYKEGIKVQNAWLYRFLRDPDRLRFTTVLRMPRFNLAPDEAQSLANYFAAVDGAPYPYQPIPQREPEYLARMQDMLRAIHRDAPPAVPGANGNGDGVSAYLNESWEMLNAPLCIKCHSVGGRQVQIQDPAKDIRGPDLHKAADRLRPDWLQLWLYKPQWITPYTSMPAPLPRNSRQFEDLFGGQAGPQTVALRDALINYHRLLEARGRYEDRPQPPATDIDATDANGNPAAPGNDGNNDDRNDNRNNRDAAPAAARREQETNENP